MAARYRYQVEDRNVPHHKGMTFILEAQGVFLVHPDAPHLLIVVEFSERAEASVARTEATVGDSYLAQLHLVRVDTAAVRRVAIGSYPDRVWLAHGSIWALSKPEVGTDLIRIDPSNLTILARVHFDGLISDLAPTPDAIWVTDRQNGVLLRLNPATGATTATVKCGGHPGHLLATSEVLWVTDRENGTIQSVDARSLKLVGKPIRELKHPDSMVDGGGVLWIVNKDQSRTVACLDPKTRELVGAAIPVGAGANSMAYGAGSLWVVCEEIDSIQRLDPVKHVVASTIPLGFQPSGMAFAGGVLWVGSWSTGRLMAVDPATNNLREKSCQAGLRISGLAGSDEGVWFADSPAGTVSLMPLP